MALPVIRVWFRIFTDVTAILLERTSRQFQLDRRGTMTQTTIISTPVGPMRAEVDDTGLIVLDFLQRAMPSELAECHVTEEGPLDHPILSQTVRELVEYFAGERQRFTIPLSPRGTDFEKRTWAALLEIPFGQTRSYGQQATALGMPTASRAVGGANGRNHVAIVIPCHRVIGANGSLTGYGGGMDRKKWLLDFEARALGTPSTVSRQQRLLAFAE